MVGHYRQLGLDAALDVTRAVADETRLRILALLSRDELNVSDLATILEQSQPRVSHHLKLLNRAGLIDRLQEGSWAYYCLAKDTPQMEIGAAIVEHLRQTDPMLSRDRARLALVKEAQAKKAEQYFESHAENWDQLRALYVDEAEVEQVIVALLGDRRFGCALDIGTGTGRMLHLIADQTESAVGIDANAVMLQVARANLAKGNYPNCQVRQADLYHLPFDAGRFELVLFHQVLHYLEEPMHAILEAQRVLTQDGLLLIIDFAPHQNEFLRQHHAHRRLGIADSELQRWLNAVGLTAHVRRRLAAPPDVVNGLTVNIWCASPSATAQSEQV